MRVISGTYKHRHFDIPHTFKARPTTDFAKENLFNVLAGYLDYEAGVRALDLFAGTGSIGVELASRGCTAVTSVEKERSHYLFICKVKLELGCENWRPLRADAFKFLHDCKEQFDFIFADPPYELPGIDTLPDLVLGGHLLADGGLFVLEHGKKNSFETHPRYLEHRRYGSVNFTFFR